MVHTTAPVRTSTRIKSLDGLRGIAAVIVLIHHSLLLVPALASPYYSDKPVSTIGSWDWWLIHSPLHLLWEGKAAVYVFFVLSGIVLTLPVIASPAYSWKAFYPQRLVRLYVPVWGAVIFTVATFWILPRVGQPVSEWLLERPTEVTTSALLKDLTLVAGNGGLASPLWSLRWEILFSLAIPLYIWVAKKLGRKSWALAIASLPVVAVGGVINESILLYTPMFMVGVVIAVNMDQVKAWAGSVTEARAGAWWMILVAGLLACNAHWFALAFDPSTEVLGSMKAVTLVGAAALVFVALGWDSVRKALENRAVLWLGKMSFSLYLIHEPIVVGFGFLLGPGYAFTAIIASIAVSLAITPIFFHVVEQTSHDWAKKLRSRMS